MTTQAPAKAPYLTYVNGTFLWIGQPANKDIPKGAGFRYNPKEFYWWTRDFDVAAKIDKRYADEKALAVIGDRLKEHEAAIWTPGQPEPIYTPSPVVIDQEAIRASRATDSDIEIPAPAGLEYMPFQKGGIAAVLYFWSKDAPEGLNIMATSTGGVIIAGEGGALIGDEMGLGKTIQALGLMNATGIDQALVVVPASLKINWRREAEKWLVRKDLWVGVAGDLFPASAHVCIINYEILQKHWRYITARRWPLLIADEAHKLKNPNAQRTKLVDEIDCEKRLYLTGTPIVNRPIELWTLISRLDPKTYNDDTKNEYVQRYCYTSAGTPHGRQMLAELQAKLRSTVMVRRLKRDVLKDMPSKLRSVIELPAGVAGDAVSKEQAAIAEHTEALAELRLRVELAKASEDQATYNLAVKNLKEGVSEAFGQISRLRHETALAKVPAVTEHVKTVLEAGQKVVLFAHHHDVMDAYREAFDKVAVKLDGTMSQVDRQSSIDRFQRDDKVKLFVGSIQAAGVGITLTSSSHVIFAELDWVPGNMSQAEDRCHRIGQVNSVLVEHLVLEGSLDATMAKTLVAKQKVIDAALDNEGAQLAQEPLVPIKDDHATSSVTRDQIARDAMQLSYANIVWIANAVRGLRKSPKVTNRTDAAILDELALLKSLTPRQAAMALRIVKKYTQEKMQ